MKLSIVHINHVNRKFFSLPPWMQKPQYGPLVGGSFILIKGKLRHIRPTLVVETCRSGCP